MEKLKENVRFSIKKKFLILIASIILFISASLVLFFYITSKNELSKEVEKRGLAEVKSLALDVEYAVLTKNTYSMGNILMGRLVKPDIVSVSITGENDETLSRHRRDGYDLLLKTNEPIIELGKNIYRSSLSLSSNANVRIYEFAVPILTEKMVSKELENELDAIMMGNGKNGTLYSSSQIGMAKVAISMERVDKQMANLFFISIFIVLVLIAVSIVISVFFTNMIVKPIRNVTLAAIEISEGNLTKRADVNTSDETGILAVNFNKMAVSMQHTVNNLKNEILNREKMEQELRSTKDQLQDIIDNTTAVIYIKDIEGRYLLINKRFEMLFHISKQMIIGKTDYDIFPKEIADGFRKHDINVIKSNVPIEVEEIAQHDDGIHTYISVKFPVYDSFDKLYGVCGISTDITDRKEIEKEILEIEENERNRIGRDLHDGIGQLLTGIFLKSQVLQKVLDKKTLGGESKEAGEIAELTKDTIRHTQTLVRGLSPLREDENNICEMLEELAHSVQKTHGIASCSFDCGQNALTLDYSAITNIYRIAQEAVNNAIKHANAKNITIKVFSGNGMTTFQIKDDGIGIGELPYRGKGLGLRTMKYRANLIGASLDILKDSNGGTIVDLSLKESPG